MEFAREILCRKKQRPQNSHLPTFAKIPGIYQPKRSQVVLVQHGDGFLNGLVPCLARMLDDQPNAQNALGAVLPERSYRGHVLRFNQWRGNRKSNWHAISIEFVVFVITTLAGAKVRKIMDELNGMDPFNHLETQLVLDT